MQTLPSCSVFAVKKTAPSSVKTRTSAPRAGLPPWKLVSTHMRLTVGEHIQPMGVSGRRTAEKKHRGNK